MLRRGDKGINQIIRFQMPEEFVSAYDWTSSLEKQMVKNLHSGSQKVLIKPNVFNRSFSPLPAKVLWHWPYIQCNLFGELNVWPSNQVWAWLTLTDFSRRFFVNFGPVFKMGNAQKLLLIISLWQIELLLCQFAKRLSVSVWLRKVNLVLSQFVYWFWFFLIPTALERRRLSYLTILRPFVFFRDSSSGSILRTMQQDSFVNFPPPWSVLPSVVCKAAYNGSANTGVGYTARIITELHVNMLYWAKASKIVCPN